MTTVIKSPKKLIEVALPLDDINTAAAREKSIRHGHPSTLHLWWARRPLAAARAVLFAQLVNDPGYQRELGYGVNKKEAEIKRERLFQIIRDLVKWENTNNEEVLNRAREAIRESWWETCHLNRNHPQAAELFNPDKLPAFHDPFAGGGAIPLEAQRLGLESYASDLNPVAVMINKAMIEIPTKFAGRAPVGPLPEGEKYASSYAEDWSGARGLAEDVRRYGHWMREEAFKRIGHLYPKVEITPEMVRTGSAGVPPACGQDARAPREDLRPYLGQELTVIAWLWARTVKSPNPAFSHVDVPLASSFVLSSKKGKEAYVEPVVEGDSYRFEVKVGTPPAYARQGTTAGKRNAFSCLLSGSPIDYKYIRSEGKSGRMDQRLMAIVAEGSRGRVYLSPTAEMIEIANSANPDWRPEHKLPVNPRDFKTPNYGLDTFGDLFTPRQLVALTTFSDLVQEAREKVIADHLGARASRPQTTVPDPRWHSRGYLPHFEGGEIPQAITFRLHDSLPKTLREQWQAELERLPKDQQMSARRKRIDAALDAGHGSCYLAQPKIAQCVMDALLHFDQQRYRLHRWVIMPNHVHVLITPLKNHTLSEILHSWKSYTAKVANQLLGRSGPFWLEEYFDRAIRDDNHYASVIDYIDNNPVRAGLCQRADEWRYGAAGNVAGSAAILAAQERAGRPRSQDETPLAEGGAGATAYGDAVAVYLGFGVSRLSDIANALCRWEITKTQVRNLFGRQAIPMIWDFAENNLFGEAAGDYQTSLRSIVRVIERQTLSGLALGQAIQVDAAIQAISNGKVISSDPPYYDNIGYADLSDFFYVWMRRSLRSIYPDLFATMAVPKAEELVATPYHHGSKEKAETFFMEGMTRAIHNLAEQAHPAFPVTIYYAFKQAETKEGSTTSTGWVTFLEAVIQAGFSIDGTWPMRTEMANRMIGSGNNALASSIVLVCRKRETSADSISRRDFQRQLREEMPEALETMIGGVTGQTPIAPVDLAQAAIGPGMAIYSKYQAVLNQDGSKMRVHDALVLINRAITDYLSPESGNFDADTQFCSGWFDQYGWSTGPFGEADTLSRAKGTSVDGVREAGVVESGGGKVRLLKWSEYAADWDPATDKRLPIWEICHQMIRRLNNQGETAAGELLAKISEKGEPVRQLAYHLYTLCERKKWAEDARAYNELIGSWPAIVAASHEVGHVGSQTEFEL